MVFSEEAAAEKARMLVEILSAPYDVGTRTARLSASVGCSLFHSGDETTEVLIHKAETALYSAKRSGRGAVVVFTRRWRKRPSASRASSRRCGAPFRPAMSSPISSRSSI